jgi:hypothetical protein
MSRTQYVGSVESRWDSETLDLRRLIVADVHECLYEKGR